jgi:hypothetical protein
MDAKIQDLIDKMSKMGFATNVPKDDTFKKLKKAEIKELCISMEKLICHLGARVDKATDFYTAAWKKDKEFCKSVAQEMKSEVF